MKWYQRMNPFFKMEGSNMSNAGRWLADLLSSGFMSFTGKEVTVKSALSNTAVNAAVRVIAETIASVPLHVYERVGEDGKKKARGHPLYKILHNKPNSQMTAFSFWEAALFWVLLGDGNFYAEIERNNGKDIIAMWPLISDKMKIYKKDGEIIYAYTLPDGTTANIPSDKIFHIHGLSSNGIKGFTPLQMAKEAIGLGLAVEEFGNRFFGNGGNVGGVLEHPGDLGDEGRKNLRQSHEETFGGLSKSHRLLILEEGMKYVRMGIPPNEAQFLETRRFNVTDIARFFRVPPHMIADLERSTNNNIEHQSLEFVKYTLLPWVIRTKYRGELAIHASKKMDKQTCEHDFFKSILAKHGYTAANLPIGAILGTVILEDCHRVTDELNRSAVLENGLIVDGNEYWFGNYGEGRFAWELADIERLDQPIPAKGQLGLWNYEEANPV